MLSFIRHLLRIVLTLALATFSIFLLVRAAPADPVTLMLAKPVDQVITDKDLKQAEIERRKEELGLNDSMMKQYARWMGHILQGDLGTSIVTGQSIADSMRRFLPHSLLLAALGCVLQLVLASGVGFYSAYFYNRWPDHLLRVVCIFFRSLPSFVICLILLSLFATRWGIYEISTSASLSRLALPAVAVALSTFPRLARIIRNAILDEIGQQYVVVYISRGFSKGQILRKAFRNALLPVCTALSMTFASSIGGMVVTESIFSWPGIGDYGMSSIMRQDYPAIQAYVLVVTVLVILVNAVTDWLYPLLLPRLRRS